MIYKIAGAWYTDSRFPNAWCKLYRYVFLIKVDTFVSLMPVWMDLYFCNYLSFHCLIYTVLKNSEDGTDVYAIALFKLLLKALNWFAFIALVGKLFQLSYHTESICWSDFIQCFYSFLLWLLEILNFCNFYVTLRDFVMFDVIIFFQESMAMCQSWVDCYS